MNQHDLNREALEKLIHKTNYEQRGFIHFTFSMDWKTYLCMIWSLTPTN